MHQRAQQKYVPPYHFATVYAGLGENDLAFAWLERAYADHSYWMIYLNVEPTLDGLRRDPRFDDLLRRMNLRIAG